MITIQYNFVNLYPTQNPALPTPPQKFLKLPEISSKTFCIFLGHRAFSRDAGWSLDIEIKVKFSKFAGEKEIERKINGVVTPHSNLGAGTPD